MKSILGACSLLCLSVALSNPPVEATLPPCEIQGQPNPIQVYEPTPDPAPVPEVAEVAKAVAACPCGDSCPCVSDCPCREKSIVVSRQVVTTQRFHKSRHRVFRRLFCRRCR